MKAIAFVFFLLLICYPAFAARNNNSTGGNSTVTPPPTSIVDKALAKYDVNHDGQLEREELHQMYLLEPDLFKRASAFDTRHELKLDTTEISAWREYERLSAKK